MKRSADDANGSSSGPTKRSRESADCPHPASWHGMCISCGKSVEGAKGVQQTIGGGVTLEYNSRETVARAGQLRETLETEQKLALALDLDHTLLHTTMNPGAPEYLKKVYNGQIVKMDEVGSGRMREVADLGVEGLLRLLWCSASFSRRHVEQRSSCAAGQGGRFGGELRVPGVLARLWGAAAPHGALH